MNKWEINKVILMFYQLFSTHVFGACTEFSGVLFHSFVTFCVHLIKHIETFKRQARAEKQISIRRPTDTCGFNRSLYQTSFYKAIKGCSVDMVTVHLPIFDAFKMQELPGINLKKGIENPNVTVIKFEILSCQRNFLLFVLHSF